MKKLFLFLLLLFVTSNLYAKYVQTYKVVFDSTTEKTIFTMVDQLRVGTSTNPADCFIIMFGSGSAKIREIHWLDGTTSTSNVPSAGVAGAGKTVIQLSPGSVKLPNVDFARPEKISRTNGVDNVLKFSAGALAKDDTGYYQVSVPTSYGGGNLTITIYSLVPSTEAAGTLAQFNFQARAKSHGEAWDVAYTSIGTVNINPTGTANQVLVDTIAWTSNLPTAGDIVGIKVFVSAINSTFVAFDAELYVLKIRIEED